MCKNICTFFKSYIFIQRKLKMGKFSLMASSVQKKLCTIYSQKLCNLLPFVQSLLKSYKKSKSNDQKQVKYRFKIKTVSDCSFSIKTHTISKTNSRFSIFTTFATIHHLEIFNNQTIFQCQLSRYVQQPLYKLSKPY